MKGVECITVMLMAIYLRLNTSPRHASGPPNHDVITDSDRALPTDRKSACKRYLLQQVLSQAGSIVRTAHRGSVIPLRTRAQDAYPVIGFDATLPDARVNNS